MSDLYKELEEVTQEQYQHQDLPKWLADPVLEVARNPERYVTANPTGSLRASASNYHITRSL